MNNPQKPKLGRPFGILKGTAKGKMTVSIDLTIIEAFQKINEELQAEGGKLSPSALVNNYFKSYLLKEYPSYLESE